MIDLVRTSLINQFGAGLTMLEDCIQKCPDSMWGEAVGRIPFWHVAYHILFFTDLYCSVDEHAFKPQPFHRENYNFLDRQPFPPFKPVAADQPYDKSTLLGYSKTCKAKVVESVSKETESTLAGPSGFEWIRIPRLEAHLYNIRHIQHHTGQLSAALNRTQGEGGKWIGTHAL